jgi:hypothetical protein
MAISDRPTLPDGFLNRSDDDSGETSPPPLDAVPWLMLSDAAVKALSVAHSEGRLLSLIDGRTSVGALVDAAGLPRGDVMRLLARWSALGVITFHATAPSQGRRA